jgi:hypothetical protein
LVVGNRALERATLDDVPVDPVTRKAETLIRHLGGIQRAVQSSSRSIFSVFSLRNLASGEVAQVIDFLCDI